MGYIRLFRRVRIAPGLSLNLSKSGPSLSLGVKGAHVTLGPKGIRKTVGLPGTGVFYTSQAGWHTGGHTAQHFAPPPEPAGVGHVLTVAFNRALVALGALLLLLFLIGWMAG